MFVASSRVENPDVGILQQLQEIRIRGNDGDLLRGWGSHDVFGDEIVSLVGIDVAMRPTVVEVDGKLEVGEMIPHVLDGGFGSAI